MKIALIAAIGRNGELGFLGDLPWKIPEDLKFFREKTEGNVLVMGRKTFESIKKPLRNRTVIVLTTKTHYSIDLPDYHVMNTIGEVMEYCHKNDVSNLYVAGGGEMYLHFLPLADQMYLTKVEAEFDADVYFPSFAYGDWDMVSVRHSSNEQYEYRFEYYEKGGQG